MEFDWENEDAPSCVYSADGDLMDCYITKIKFSKDFSLTCTKVTLHAYYVGENINDFDDIVKYNLKKTFSIGDFAAIENHIDSFEKPILTDNCGR